MADRAVRWHKPHEATTLRRFLLRNYRKGMPESVIAFPLQETLKGLRHIQTTFRRDPEVNSGRICFFVENFVEFPVIGFRLAYSKRRMRRVGPEKPGVGVWGVGIVALELAYGSGSLPKNMSPQQMFTLGNNMLRILRQKLENEEKKIKKLPSSLQMLLDDRYVDRRERELVEKRNARGIQRAIKIVESSVRSLPLMDSHQKKSFSRDFLDVVMRCLDREHPTPIYQILNLPFFLNADTGALNVRL